MINEGSIQMSKLPTLVLYNINHRPRLDVFKVIEVYTQKDGVPISYLCSTELEHDNTIVDIFYRATPHPEFKNRYFGFSKDALSETPRMIIRSADNVENYKFDMIKCGKIWHYSQARHDCSMTDCGGIDGGRRYTRIIGNAVGVGLPQFKTFVVRDGVFVEHQPLEKN
jgi:hypothetical protein